MEQQLGSRLPAALRALYSIANGGLVAICMDITPIQNLLRHHEDKQRMFWDAAEELILGNWPVGDPPSSAALPFASFDQYSYFMASAGSDEGAIYSYHGRIEPVEGYVPWRRLSSSLVAVVQASTAFLKAGSVRHVWNDQFDDPTILPHEPGSEPERRGEEIFRTHGVNPKILDW